MTKLELKHLACYLPYGLKFLTVFDKQTPKLLTGICGNIIYYEDHEKWIAIDAIKPILRPLSDLSKEITHNGETFVPILRLLDITTKINWSNSDYVEANEGLHEYWASFIEKPSSIFGFNSEGNHFFVIDQYGHYHTAKHQLDMFQNLYEWHFDLDGLIPAGLAISFEEAGL